MLAAVDRCARIGDVAVVTAPAAAAYAGACGLAAATVDTAIDGGRIQARADGRLAGEPFVSAGAGAPVPDGGVDCASAAAAAISVDAAVGPRNLAVVAGPALAAHTESVELATIAHGAALDDVWPLAWRRWRSACEPLVPVGASTSVSVCGVDSARALTVAVVVGDAVGTRHLA